MFVDFLDAYQDFPEPLPMIGEQGVVLVDLVTGEHSPVRGRTYRHEGSFSTSIAVRVAGSRLYVSGNPSKFDRLDNVVGVASVDEAFRVFNRVLLSLGLPPFLRCSRVWRGQSLNGAKHCKYSDGAVITRIDVTTNLAVGAGNELSYLRALSGQRYRNSIGRLHTNGCTVDWLSADGNARLVYPSVYIKANEIDLHDLPKIKRAHGADSFEFNYLKQVRDYCAAAGLVRFEQKLRGEFLRSKGVAFWGLQEGADDMATVLLATNDYFLSINNRLQVTALTLENIAERLVSCGVVDTTKAANTTSLYAIQWMHGTKFDLSLARVKVHRARLRQIGIDIANPCDLASTSPVHVVKARDVTVRDFVPPAWYQYPKVNHLKAA